MNKTKSGKHVEHGFCDSGMEFSSDGLFSPLSPPISEVLDALVS